MNAYIKEVKQRMELCKNAPNQESFIFYAYALIDYLEGLEHFVDKRLVCETCGRPLYQRQDGSLTCVEMHH